MRTSVHVSLAVLWLPALFACRSANAPEPPKPLEGPQETVTTVTLAGRSEGVNAVPTGDPGVYRIDVGIERIDQVRIVPVGSDATPTQVVEAGRWSFDRTTGRLRIDVPVDDARERVIVLGARARPPRAKLPDGVDFASVRVVVGDRLGVEGEDYTLDRSTGRLEFLGPDTPEHPLRYFVQASLRSDPAHPEIGQSVAFGNRSDMETVRRILGSAGR